MCVRPLLIVTFFLCAGLAHVCGQTDEGFVLVREADSIFIYERWIKFPDTNPPQDAREVKGEFTATATFQEVIKLLKDPKWVMKSQRHVSEFKVYPLPVDTAWLEYSYHDIPWPVSDQDHFLIYKILRSTDQELFLSFESIQNDKLAPVRSGVDRMNLLGSWRLQKIDGEKIKATYRIISQPSNIPRIFTDPIIRRNIVTTIQSIIEILENEEL